MPVIIRPGKIMGVCFKSLTSPGSYSMVVSAAVEPSTERKRRPSFTFSFSAISRISAVISTISQLPLVRFSIYRVTMFTALGCPALLPYQAQVY